MPNSVNAMGYEGILLFGTAGSTAATQVTNCIDLDYDSDIETGETTTRGDGSVPPIETEDVTKRKALITWKMVNKKADTTLAALLAAARTGAHVALRTKDHAAGKGYDGDCIVKAKNGAPLSGAQTFEFEGRPTDGAGRTPLLNA